MIHKSHFAFKGLFVFFYIVFYSCSPQSEDLLSIGNNFIDPSTRLTKVDTFGISLSTIIVDSLVTSNTEIALVGNYSDEKTGSTNSNSYFQIGLPDSYNIQTYDIYDSVALVLNYSAYYQGDTSQLFSISAHRVLEEMEVFDDGYLYNNSSFSYALTSLGTMNFYPRPESENEVLLKLDDNLGAELFQKLKDNEDEISSSAKFLEYFKGLVLLSNNDINKAMLGFGLADSTLNLRLYCHRIDEELVEFEVDFPVLDNSLRFNQITSDKSNTALENLIEQRYAMHSSLTNNIAYVKGGTGLMTTISFPWLNSLVEITDGDLFRAELVLYPIINDENIDFIPEDFLLYEGGKYNTLEGTYVDSGGETYYGTVNKDKLTNQASITFDITDYIKSEIADSYYDTERRFILSYDSPDYNTSINQVEIGGYGNKQYQPSLNIYYIHYNTY